MATESTANGESFLPKLDQYWIKRGATKPIVMPNERLIAVSHEHWIKYVFPSVLHIRQYNRGCLVARLSVILASVS